MAAAAGYLLGAIPFGYLVARAKGVNIFEVGSKNRFLDNRLQVNGDFFYYRYGGQQMLVQIGNLFPGGPPIVQPMVTPSRMIGAELEVNYRPTVADRFGLNLSYVNGYFVDKSALFAIGVANTRMADVIPWILTPSYSHSFALANGQALTFNIEGIYHSGYLVTNLPQSYLGVSAYMRNGDVLQGNANLSWELGKYSISAYARNFTNQRYKTYINLQSSTDGTANEAVLSDPRTFGVVASARF